MPYRIATKIPNPIADCVVQASRTTRAITSGNRSANDTMTMAPPVTYRPTLTGTNFSIARPIAVIPPTITSHVRTATTTPITQLGTPNTLWAATAIELGCVNGVDATAATPATNA